MPSTRNSRIQILTSDEIDELYRRPAFNQTEREEFFSLDTRALEHIRKMEKLESRVHFILLMGYFRSKPVIPQFHLKDVRQDVRYTLVADVMLGTLVWVSWFIVMVISPSV